MAEEVDCNITLNITAIGEVVPAVLQLQPKLSRSVIQSSFKISKSYLRGRDMRKGFEALMISTIEENSLKPKNEIGKIACKRWRHMNAMDKLNYIKTADSVSQRQWRKFLLDKMKIVNAL